MPNTENAKSTSNASKDVDHNARKMPTRAEIMSRPGLREALAVFNGRDENDDNLKFRGISNR